MHKLTLISRVNYSFSALIGSLLLFFTVFPYIQLLPSESYTQPYALILGAVLFVMQGQSVLFRLARVDQIALLGLATVGVTIFLVTCFPYDNSQEYKYLISYLSPLLITVPLLSYLKNYPGCSIRILKLAIFLWVTTSAIQKFLDPNFLGFLIGHWSESAQDLIESGRGVLGLAPEPTHHAFHILLLAASLSLIDQSRGRSLMLMLCIADAVLLAASASAILLLGISGGVWLIFYRQRWLVLVIILAAIVLLNGPVDEILIKSDLRAVRLIGDFFAEPSSILSADRSINTRVGGGIAVFSDAFSNLLIPHGMSVQSWEFARDDLLIELPWLMDLSLVGPPSGIGLLIFQAGLFGAVLIGLVFYRILDVNVDMLGRILLISSLIIFFSQYYISAPTFSLLYACALYRLDRRTIFHREKYHSP